MFAEGEPLEKGDPCCEGPAVRGEGPGPDRRGDPYALVETDRPVGGVQRGDQRSEGVSPDHPPDPVGIDPGPRSVAVRQLDDQVPRDRGAHPVVLVDPLAGLTDRVPQSVPEFPYDLRDVRPARGSPPPPLERQGPAEPTPGTPAGGGGRAEPPIRIRSVSRRPPPATPPRRCSPSATGSVAWGQTGGLSVTS